MAVENWGATEFATFYRVRDGRPGSPTFGTWLGYGREFWSAMNAGGDHLAYFRARWAHLTAAFPIQPQDRVLIVGAAFGFLIEAAKEAGFPNVYGIDSSPEVAAKRSVEVADGIVIVEDDVRGGGRVRTALRQATGASTFRWVITEDVVACYAQADVVQLAPILETLLENGAPTTNVIHMTSVASEPGVGGDTAFTWLTIAEWKALLPGHSWISMTGEVG